MSTSKRSLDELFERARTEQAPPDSFDLQQPIHVHTTPRRSFLMSPLFIATTVAAIAAAGAITVSVIHDGSDTQKKVIQASNTPSAIASTQTSNTLDPSTKSLAIGEPNSDQNNQNTRIIISTKVNDDGVQTSSVSFCAIRCDDKIESSLSIEPGALGVIRSGLFSADSLTRCSVRKNDDRVMLCMFHDGSPKEVVFMDKPGPLPVMFTSANGRGHVVASFFPTELDANNLIPVATPENDDVIMWFPPTMDFLNSLPDSLARDLESSIVLDIRMADNKHVIHVQKNVNEANDGKVTQFWVDSTMHLGNLDIDKLMSSMNFTTDTLMSCFKSFKMNIGAVDSAVLDLKTRLLIDAEELDIETDKLNLKQEDLRDHNVQINIRSSRTPKLNSQIIVITKHGATKKTAPSNQDAKLQETRTSMGAITNTTVFPNPTSDGGATLKFTLMSERTLTVALHDLSGNLVSMLAEGVRRGAGEGQIAFTLSNVPAGMYLVTVTTDQNEKIVQRLIVQ